MSNYSKTTDFAAKDSLTTGDPNKIVAGTEIDTEFNNIATAVATKANKKVPATTGNMATLDASGDLGDSGFKFSGAGGTVTADASEINTVDGLTATTAELNTLDGITSTTAELNLLDGVTATTAEINVLAGMTATTAELNVLDGPNVANKALVLDSSGYVPDANLSLVTEVHSGSFASVGSSSNSSLATVALTSITSVHSIILSGSTSNAATADEFLISARDSAGFIYGSNLGTLLTQPSSGNVSVMMQNTDSTTRTLYYKITVIGTR